MATTGERTTAAGLRRAPGVTRGRHGEWDVAVQLSVDRAGQKAEVERVVRRKIAWLRRHFPDITSCRVMIDVPHRSRRRGRLHRVRIGIILHGGPLNANRGPSIAAHEDAMVAIHDGFAAMHRELTSHDRRERPH
jgi:ribosome-associated translation inhibitor RaiA